MGHSSLGDYWGTVASGIIGQLCPGVQPAACSGSWKLLSTMEVIHHGCGGEVENSKLSYQEIFYVYMADLELRSGLLENFEPVLRLNKRTLNDGRMCG